MTDETAQAPDLQQLHALAELHEQPFQSNVPLIGGLIASFRAAWNSVSTKWYVRPMLAQQTEYNLTLLNYLDQLDTYSGQLAELAQDLDRRIVAQDREQVQLVRQVGESTARIAQLRAALEALEGDTLPSGDRQP